MKTALRHGLQHSPWIGMSVRKERAPSSPNHESTHEQQ